MTLSNRLLPSIHRLSQTFALSHRAIFYKSRETQQSYDHLFSYLTLLELTDESLQIYACKSCVSTENACPNMQRRMIHYAQIRNCYQDLNKRGSFRSQYASRVGAESSSLSLGIVRLQCFHGGSGTNFKTARNSASPIVSITDQSSAKRSYYGVSNNVARQLFVISGAHAGCGYLGQFFADVEE